MGKLIVCNGKQAKHPYHFKLTDTYVYSVEELCYYIYNNIEIIQEDMFSPDLVKWIQDELGLKETGDKLHSLLESKAGLKDYVVCILKSSDYYTETEIRRLLYVMNEYIHLTPFEKRKKKADNFMKYRQFRAAQIQYEEILSSPEAAGIDNRSYGALLHNLAVAQAHTEGPGIAADWFKEAYERGHNKESLKEYFCSLILSKQEERLKKEAMNYGVEPEYLGKLQNEVNNLYEEAEASEDYQVITKLREEKDSKVPFYDLAGKIISQWKQEYRKENS
ncbi:MAG: TPR-REGION domain-containing protein [Lachnoclostridium sp.]